MTKKVLRWPIIGCEPHMQFLQKSFETDTRSHAYLVHGQRHTGKKHFARMLTRSILCVGNETLPCNECQSCKLSVSTNHPDLITLSEYSDGPIGIEGVRNFNRLIRLKASLAREKAGLIYDAERLTHVAANALLKLLEDAPQNLTVILTCSDIAHIPATIISRCQLIKLKPLTRRAMDNWLAAIELDGETRNIIARLSRGRIGVAHSLMSDNLDRYTMLMGELIGMCSASRIERLAYAEKIAAKKTSGDEAGDSPDTGLRLRMEYLETLFRDLMIFKLKRRYPMHASFERPIAQLAHRFSLATLVNALRMISSVRESIGGYRNNQLALESFFQSL